MNQKTAKLLRKANYSTRGTNRKLKRAWNNLPSIRRAKSRTALKALVANS